jgi:hypothetical protein
LTVGSSLEGASVPRSLTLIEEFLQDVPAEVREELRSKMTAPERDIYIRPADMGPVHVGMEVLRDTTPGAKPHPNKLFKVALAIHEAGIAENASTLTLRREMGSAVKDAVDRLMALLKST